jgi:N-acetylglucosaminyldiphosphoundecaprenol N-acetyl-beta-D-mannosaminyltransferase
VSFFGKTIIHCINTNAFDIATKDADLKAALKTADILTLDSFVFGWGGFLLKGKIIKKQYGPNNFKHFMKKIDEISGKVFFLGSTEETLSLMKKRANIEYRNIQIETFSPPFKKEFSDDDNKKMTEAINAFKPHLLCVGMTCPKQEKWIYKNYLKLDVNIIITIGQVFDWYSGKLKEPHPLWAKLNLLWLIRTIERPEILKRYPTIFKFIWYLFLNIIKIRKD